MKIVVSIEELIKCVGDHKTISDNLTTLKSNSSGTSPRGACFLDSEWHLFSWRTHFGGECSSLLLTVYLRSRIRRQTISQRNCRTKLRRKTRTILISGDFQFGVMSAALFRPGMEIKTVPERHPYVCRLLRPFVHQHCKLESLRAHL